MAFFRRSTDVVSSGRVIKILSSESCDNYTVYIIEVNIGLYRWQVRHRYSDFHELHEKLSSQYSLDRSMLPRKKFFGNQSEKFVCKRQKELEHYLQSLLSTLPKISYTLMVFLDFHKYEIHGITQTLSELLFNSGDDFLKADKTFHMTPLQLYALCARLKLPEAACDADEACRDLGHLLDFVTRVRHLQIDGSSGLVGTSNINMNELVYDLHCFKSLTTLELVGCNVQMLSEVEHLKKRLTYLRSYNSVNQLKNLLLVGVGIGQWAGVENETLIVQAWSEIVTADFSHNHIATIDESIKLMPRVERLSLRHNRLEDVNYLQFLSSLRVLDVSHNRIRTLDNLHTRLGNITALNLSWNKLESLQGLSKVYSLQALDVSFNEIFQVMELRYLSSLPCLERLNLQGNPVTSILDYRTTMFELFSERAGEVCLDGQKANSRELDTVAVRVAMHKSRELKSTRAGTKNKKKSVAKEVTIVDVNQSDCTDAAQQQISSNTVSNVMPSPVVGSSTEKQPASATGAHTIKKGHLTSELAVESCAPDFPLGYQPSWYQHRSPAKTTASTTTYFMLPETLPSCNDKQFISHLMSECLDVESGNEADSDEIAIHVVWCVAVCYTNSETEFPACVLITTRFIHIFSVQSLLRVEGGLYPRLKRVFCIPLASLQQVAIGYDSLYVQIEEADVGERGTYALMTMNKRKTDLFVDSLKRAVRHTIPDLDAYEDPNIISIGNVGNALQPVLDKFELSDNIDISLYALVVTRNGSEGELFVTRSLVISSSHVYLLKQDYVNQPAPTFIISIPATRPSFQVLAVFPVNARVINVNMYDDCAEIDFTSAVGAVSNQPWHQFSGFGVCLTFNLGGTFGVQSLDIRMPTSCQRDNFLTTLMHARPRDVESLALPPLHSRLMNTSRHSTDRDDSSSNGSGGSKKASRRHKMSKSYAFSAVRTQEEPPDLAKLRTSSVPNLVTSNQNNDDLDSIPQRDDLKKTYSSVTALSVQSDDVSNSLKEAEIINNTNKLREAMSSDFSTCQRAIITSSDCVNEPIVMRSDHHVMTSDIDSSYNSLLFDKSATDTSNSSEFQVTSEKLTSSDNLVSCYVLSPPMSPTAKTSPSASPDAEEACSSCDDAVDRFKESIVDVQSDHSPETTLREISLSTDMDDFNILREVSLSTNMDDVNILQCIADPIIPAIGSVYVSQRCDTDVSLNVHSLGSDNSSVEQSLDKYMLSTEAGYPSEDLLARLNCCCDRPPVCSRASPVLSKLASLSGLELVNYFHMAVAAVGPESAAEQLFHVLWTAVASYSSPMCEVPSVIFLSTRAVYFVSDESTLRAPVNMTSKSHARHFSDEVRHVKVKDKDSNRRMKDLASSEGSKHRHLSCGVLSEVLPRRDHQTALVYAVIPIKDLSFVHLGLFDQIFRLTSCDSTVLTCLTRDYRLTNEFVVRLNEVIALLEHATVVETTTPAVEGPENGELVESEIDFYKKFSRNSRMEIQNCKQSKHVRICYPPDDCVADISFVICGALRGHKQKSNKMKIHFYMLCFQTQLQSIVESVSTVNTDSLHPRTLILTDEHLALAVEDHVSYPLPDFARMLPDQPHTEITEVRYLEFLVEVVLSDVNKAQINFVFTDETGELVIDPTRNYYGDVTTNVPVPIRRITWVLMVQNSLDRDKLLKVVSRQWTEVNGGETLKIVHGD